MPHKNSRSKTLWEEANHEAAPQSTGVVQFSPVSKMLQNADQFGPSEVVDEVTRIEIGRVFGAEVLSDPAKARAVTRSIAVFREETGRILASVVQMGRTLIDLSASIGREEAVRAMREGKLLFRGWSRGNLVKMMAVAEFVDMNAGTISLNDLPQSWSTVYELSTLPPALLERARQGDLIRPTATRDQVKDFKRRIFEVGVNGAIEVLPSEMARIDKELVTARARLASLDVARKQQKERVLALEARRAEMTI